MVEVAFGEIPHEYIGKSTEIKPTEGERDASTFYEVDTRRMFIFYAGEWFPMNDD